VTSLTVALALVCGAFAWSIGAHYTGACMGMPYGSGSIRLWPALLIMAPMAWLGAATASHGVEATVGWHLVDPGRMTVAGAVAAVLGAFLLTTVYTAVRVPTSTIQILVFTLVGAAVGAAVPVHWATVLRLAAVWVAAPPVAGGLGFALTRVIDRLWPAERRRAQKGWGVALVAVGAAASFTMGANDVSNATGVLVMTHVASLTGAGVFGGGAIMVGVLTWGRPLLQRVAFDIVRVDLPMATAAQLVQALVVLSAVGLGFFTSMNQALVAAMTGAGLARGERRIDWRVVRQIVTGWALGPPSGLLLGVLSARVAAPWWHL
jgi:PiT family inorganic phosphate transporter